MLSIVLASHSPRRSALLNQIGIPFEVASPGSSELLPDENIDPFEYCRQCALNKFFAVASRFPDRVILAADTIVIHKNRILGKPLDCSDAERMLKTLSGKRHQVLSFIILFVPKTGIHVDFAVTKVVFRALSHHEIDWYLSTREWEDKAGAYGIQGFGAALVKSIDGCYWNVVGLPLEKLIDLLLTHAPEYWPPPIPAF